ncbi:hypothetical protein BJX64DRAFT_256811 [Aspergillus heterothallicus]
MNPKITYLALPPQELLRLQRQLFPIHFRSQVGLALLTTVTRPPTSLSQVRDRGVEDDVASIVPLTSSFWNRDTSVVADVLPPALVVVVGLANWLVYGPATSRAGRRGVSS